MKKCPKCGRQFEDTNTLCPVDGAVLKKGEKDDALVGQVLAGKYRIDEKIDEGGMGCVYRATHVLMEKTVAIKVLHPALAADDKIVARFTREAKAASRISHPHAINVTDFGESENGIVYLVMEYLRGRTLKDIVRSGGPMPLARVVEIVRQVAGALDAAHAEGVIHRDLKSDNIMLEEATGGDWAKVLDFGIAKIQQSIHETDPGLTAPNLIIGTPQYMSPEQCSQASDIDARSDIYSFGVIIYETLAGHVPFTGDSPTAIMLKHLQEPAPSILDERKDLPAGVGRVIARALAKRPEDRFEKASELAAALEEAAKEEVAAGLTAGAAGIVDTDRIIIPTSPNDAPRTTLEEDEATVVTARRAPATDELPPPVAPPPTSTSSFSPARVAIMAVAALAIIFAVVYAVQRRGASSTGAQTPAQPSLKTDPNGQPVQPITPPTGQAERNIAPVATPSPGAVPGQVVEVPAGAPANAAPTPTPRRGKGDNQNGQPEVVNENEGGDEPKATPTPAPRNKRLPDINANVEPPTPAPPSKKPVPRKVDEITPKPSSTPDNPPQRDAAPPDSNAPGPPLQHYNPYHLSKE
ncbi:MAG: protein kinase [Acidobacteriota bacterium]|nr:protein kinase [Acidobacteriota bacterium]